MLSRSAIDVLWTFVPIVNTGLFLVFLVALLTGSQMNRRGRIVFGFSGTSLLASCVGFIVLWLHTAATMPPGYELDPNGPFATYTVVTAWVARIGLLALGLLKAYELLRSPKTEEKKK